MIVTDFFAILLKTILDIAPIVVIIFGFQFLVIRKPITDAKRVAIGFIYVLHLLQVYEFVVHGKNNWNCSIYLIYAKFIF